MPSPRRHRARRVDDGGDDAVRDVVLDDERHERLRQEARLEDAAPVLVRDALLATVADGLDHGDADVPGRGLDGLHHRLDAVSDDDRFNFHHLPVLLDWTNKKAPGLAGSTEASLPHGGAFVGPARRHTVANASRSPQPTPVGRASSPLRRGCV